MKTIKYRTLLFFVLVSFGFSFQSNYLAAQIDTTVFSQHYVLPKFTLGLVKMKNGVNEAAIMNYNMITEEMIFDKEGTMLALDSLSLVDTVYLGSLTFIPYEKIFLEVLIYGPVSLFIQNKCNILDAGNPSGYGGLTETGASRNVSTMSNVGRTYKLKLPDDVHITPDSQYWLRKNGTYYKANSLRQIIKVFPEKSDEIKKFVKNNNIDITKTEDLITLVSKFSEPHN